MKSSQNLKVILKAFYLSCFTVFIKTLITSYTISIHRNENNSIKIFAFTPMCCFNLTALFSVAACTFFFYSCSKPFFPLSNSTCSSLCIQTFLILNPVGFPVHQGNDWNHSIHRTFPLLNTYSTVSYTPTVEPWNLRDLYGQHVISMLRLHPRLILESLGESPTIGIFF